MAWNENDFVPLNVLVNFDERLTWYLSETNEREPKLSDSSTEIKTVYVLLYGALFKMEEFNVSYQVIKAHRCHFIAGDYKLGDNQYCVLANKGNSAFTGWQSR